MVGGERSRWRYSKGMDMVGNGTLAMVRGVVDGFQLSFVFHSTFHQADAVPTTVSLLKVSSAVLLIIDQKMLDLIAYKFACSPAKYQ